MFTKLIQFFTPRRKAPAAPALPTQFSGPDEGPWRVDEWPNTDQLVLQSGAGPHGVALVINGNFEKPEQRMAYANSMATWLNDQVAACTTTITRAPQSAGVDMDNMPWEVEEGPGLSRHTAQQRRMSLGEQPADRPKPPHRAEPQLDPQPDAPAKQPTLPSEDKPFGAYGCHCELAPGQTPDGCLIDMNARADCSLAMDGRTRNSCEYWQPVHIRRAA